MIFIRPGHMYWTSGNFYINKPELIIVGVVEEVSKVIKSNDPHFPDDYPGVLRITKVLYKSQNADTLYKNQKFLRSNIFSSVYVGDTVVIFMIIYEGDFAIPNNLGNNSSLGYCINNDVKVGLRVKDFINAFNYNNIWDVQNYNSDQIMFWTEFDPDSFLWRLQIAKAVEEDEALNNMPPPNVIERVMLIDQTNKLDTIINKLYTELLKVASLKKVDTQLLEESQKKI